MAGWLGMGDWHGRLAWEAGTGERRAEQSEQALCAGRCAHTNALIVTSLLMREAINGNQHTSALILARPGRSHAQDLHALVLLVVVPRGILGDHPAVLAVDLPSENRRDGGSSIDREGSTGEEGGHQARETTGAKTGARTWALAMQRSASTCFHIGWPLASRLHTLAYTPRQGTWHLSAAISDPGLSPDRESFCGISLIDVATCAGGHGAQSTCDQRALLHSRDGC